MDFRLWLETTESLPPPEFIDGGMINLYRYSHNPRGDTYRIDPEQTGKGQNYSRNDYNASQKKRTFFYLDIDQKERIIGDHLYVVRHPAAKIYNVLRDPHGFKEEAKKGNNGINVGILNFNMLLDLIHEAEYDGIYYNPGFHVVNMFVPVLGYSITEEEVREKRAT